MKICLVSQVLSNVYPILDDVYEYRYEIVAG